ncbi:MAG: ParD-like family protein [Rickettsiales bacterium]
MSMPVKLSDNLINEAKRYAAACSRSLPKQIEHWSRIGKIAEDNPDLPYSFIHELLLSIEEVRDGEVSDFILPENDKNQTNQ